MFFTILPVITRHIYTNTSDNDFTMWRVRKYWNLFCCFFHVIDDSICHDDDDCKKIKKILSEESSWAHLKISNSLGIFNDWFKSSWESQWINLKICAVSINEAAIRLLINQFARSGNFKNLILKVFHKTLYNFHHVQLVWILKSWIFWNVMKTVAAALRLFLLES